MRQNDLPRQKDRLVRQRCHQEGLGLVSVTSLIPWVGADSENNACVYGHLFSEASDAEMATLRVMGHRWKQYEREGKWKYEGERKLTN